MENDADVKVNGSFLLPLSLKRWVESEAARRSIESETKVSAADIVREILDAARSKDAVPA